MGEFINIGVGVYIKLEDLAVMMIKEIMEFEREVRHGTSKPNSIPKKLQVKPMIKAMG